MIVTKIQDGSFVIKVDNIRTMNLLVDKLRRDGMLIKEFVLQKSTLEDMFISLINQVEKGEGV